MMNKIGFQFKTNAAFVVTSLIPTLRYQQKNYDNNFICVLYPFTCSRQDLVKIHKKV